MPPIKALSSISILLGGSLIEALWSMGQQRIGASSTLFYRYKSGFAMLIETEAIGSTNAVFYYLLVSY